MQAFARLSSSAASRRVFSGVSGAATRPCYRTWRGKAHVAPLSSQDPPKGRKRELISKKERKARIEEFVEIYQTSNDGKFPTSQLIRQHVGGSHYTVRDVLQELKYKQIKFPFDKSKIAQHHEAAECSEQSRPQEEGGESAFDPQSINGKQDEDDTLPSQKDSATGTVIMNETLRPLESQDFSHYNGQMEVAGQDLHTADANDLNPTVSEQAEIDSTKAKLQLDGSKADQLHKTAECVDQSRHEEESGNNSFNPQDFNGKQDEDDTLLSQKDSSTVMENNEPWRSLESQDSSHYNGQAEVAKQDLHTAEAHDLTLSEQAEIDSLKAKVQLDDSKAAQLHKTTECADQSRHGEQSGSNSFNPQDFNGKQDQDDILMSQKDSSDDTTIRENTEAPIPLERETKSDSENRQGETEVNKLHVNNVENFQNPSELTVSDQSESGKGIKGNVLDREENSTVEQQGPAKTSLLGSLKSFASGIRNFWRNL